jgi:ABC-type dipeptide/oligopeptide/nickel transport system permease subunit
VLGTVFVQTTLVVGTAIVLEATLSFLGQGVRPPQTSLGNLVQEGKDSIYSTPGRALWPGGIIVVIVLCINFLGDGLRDAFDPTSRKNRE